MRNGKKASPSIILVGLALLVKMFKALEPCGSFGSNSPYLCILTLRLPLASFGRSSSFNKNAHNS